MKLSVSDYGCGTLYLYDIDDDHELALLANEDPEEVINKLGHRTNNCEYFYTDSIKKVKISKGNK